MFKRKIPRTEALEKRIVAIRTADPSLTNRQIAKMVDRTEVTVGRILKRNREIIASATDKLSDVQSRLMASMPIQSRVNELVATAKDRKKATQLAAIRYINELDDIVPPIEREKVARDPARPAPQPMFILPPGTTVNFTTSLPRSDSSSLSTGVSETNISASDAQVVEVEGKIVE